MTDPPLRASRAPHGPDGTRIQKYPGQLRMWAGTDWTGHSTLLEHILTA